jgi:hypothetical protein
MEHHFNTELAKKYGIEESVLLHHFYYWIVKNAVNGKHFHDGLYWTYNTKKAYSDFFTYMNETKIFRVIKHLEEENIIVKGNYNTDKWDKTNWYAITKDGWVLLKGCGYDTNILPTSFQNDIFDSGKMNNRACQSERTIPNNNNTNNNKQEIKEYKEKDLKAKFCDFVKLYKKLTHKQTRGVETEFNDFKSRHRDWAKVIPYLSIAIERETKERESARASKKFFPEPKMLQTYLGKQRAWELYVNVGEDIQELENQYRPTTDGEIRWNDYYNCYVYVGMFWENIYDGYNENDRPNGATIMLNNGRGYIVWNSQTKKWENKK